MNKYIGLFFCLAIVISCEHSSQLSSFDYKDLKKAPVLSLEDVFEPIKFIPLKTTESHNISNILKVCMTEDSFYILAVNPYGIFRFALDGSLQYRWRDEPRENI